MFNSSVVIALYPDGYYKPYALDGYVFNRKYSIPTTALPYEYFSNIQENIKMSCCCIGYQIFLSEINIYIFPLDGRSYSKEYRACLSNPRILDVSDKNFVQIHLSSIYGKFTNILYALDDAGCIWFMDLKSRVLEFSQMSISEHVDKFQITDLYNKSLTFLSYGCLFRYHHKTKELEYLKNNVIDFLYDNDNKLLIVDVNGNLIVDDKIIDGNVTKIVGITHPLRDICYISGGSLKLYQTQTSNFPNQIDVPNSNIINTIILNRGFLCQGSDNCLYLVEETITTIISSEIDGRLEPLRLKPKFSKIKSSDF